MDYRSALAFLDEHTNLEGGRKDRFDGPKRPELPTAGQVDGLSLDPMLELMSALGDPHTAFRSIHLTGTNGKGSSARMIDAILRRMDLSVGLYTSPNMDKVNERLSWDGKDIPDEDFARVLELLASVSPLLSRKPSRFELLTAAAFVWFAEQGVEVGVVEVGLLGRYDATNVVDSDVAVLTNIGKDHTDGRDGWEQAVAAEKAGIIKPKSHVILGSPMPDLRPIIEAEPSAGLWVAGEDFEVETNTIALGGRSIDLRTPGGHYDQLYVPAHGAHQGDNAATAVAAVEAFFDKPTPEELIGEAWTDVRFPGRFEVVGREPTVILDGAHNPDGATAAYRTLTEEFARLGSWVLVVGMLSGKDPIEMLQALGAQDFDAVICTEPNWSRAIAAEEIAAAATILGMSPEVVRKPVEALERARSVTAADDLILVAGSLYVVGEIRTAIGPDAPQ
ncbi:MAG: Mur ligase family protein [Actinomycetota bacterium]